MREALVLTFKAHQKPIHGLAFSPDGTRLATTAESTRVWELSGPTKRQEFLNYYSRSIAFSPDGRFLGCGSSRPRVWDLETEKEVVAHDTYTWAPSVAFAPNGREVAAFGGQTPLSRWSLPSGEPLSGGWGGPRSADRFPGVAMTYSPDGKTIATAYWVKEGKRFKPRIFLWSRNTGKPRLEIVVGFTNHQPMTLAFSPDGSVIAGTFGPILGVIDAKSGEKVMAIAPSKKLFQGLAFTPDGKKLVAVNTNDTARVYDTATWSETTGYEWKIGKLNSVAVAPDGLRAACGSHLGRVVVWDLE